MWLAPEIREFSFYRRKLYNDGGLHTCALLQSKGPNPAAEFLRTFGQPLILTLASADAKDSFSVTVEPFFYTKSN